MRQVDWAAAEHLLSPLSSPFFRVKWLYDYGFSKKMRTEINFQKLIAVDDLTKAYIQRYHYKVYIIWPDIPF